MLVKPIQHLQYELFLCYGLIIIEHKGIRVDPSAVVDLKLI